MSEEETLLTFPCEYPIKIIGLANGEFETFVYTVIQKHVPNLHENAIQTRPSKNAKYLAITVKFTAESKKQLDNIYLELTSSKEVAMVL